MKYIKDYKTHNESIIATIGIVYLSLVGVNKLLDFFNKRLRNLNIRSTIELFLHHEKDMNIKIDELPEKFIIRIKSKLNDSVLNLILEKETKNIIFNGNNIEKLTDSEYKDFITIIEYYQIK